MVAAPILDPRQARMQMEERLATLPLEFLPHRSQLWESTPFPNMAAIYWNLARNRRVPEQDAFAGAVAALLGQGANTAVIARALRAYPALVRQHHFSLVLKEHFPIVVRSEELDLNGVDLLVVDGGRAFGIAMSVETEAAHSWQQVKQVRHPDSPEHLHVLYLYARQGEYTVGRFWLHHPDQWCEVRRWIDGHRLQDDWYTSQLIGQVVP